MVEIVLVLIYWIIIYLKTELFTSGWMTVMHE